MNITKGDSLQGQRCPYLGLHDDPSTSLAFPSTWNYCYHATPPAPVVVSHQIERCLCPQFVYCTVYLTGTRDPLPANLRGKAHGLEGQGTRKAVRLFVFGLLMLSLALFVVLQLDLVSVQAPESLRSLPYLSTLFSVQAPAPRLAEDASTLALSESLPTSSQTSMRLAGTQTAVPLPIASRPNTASPGESCGHALDTPFGSETRFVIHRVVQGENLTLYAGQFDTSTAAILAVNYDLPTPVWADSILVIPVGAHDVTGLPAFESYRASEAELSLHQLARQLNADPVALAEYNAFSERCTSFSGWLLIPRQLQDP